MKKILKNNAQIKEMEALRSAIEESQRLMAQPMEIRIRKQKAPNTRRIKRLEAQSRRDQKDYDRIMKIADKKAKERDECEHQFTLAKDSFIMKCRFCGEKKVNC